MSKRKHRKQAAKAHKSPEASRNASAPAAEADNQAEAVEADTAPAAGDQAVAQRDPIEAVMLPNAATLLDEVQQRCEKLRDWQRQTQRSLQAKAQDVDRRERAVVEIEQRVELGRTRLELDQDAFKRAKLMFDKERTQLEQSQQAIESERAQMGRARAELQQQKQEVLDMRSELDAEWASLARVRRAQEALAAALDADRERVQELRMNDCIARVGMESSDDVDDDADTDDTPPGLSLTQAA